MLELNVIGGTKVWINATQIKSVQPGAQPNTAIVTTIDGESYVVAGEPKPIASATAKWLRWVHRSA